VNNLNPELTAIFRTVFDQQNLEINEQMTAADVEGWDSISHVSLIVAIEEHFRVRFSTAEIAALKNVGDIMSLLERKKKPK
jgi:acyl carrier protein